jgi:integrase
MCWTVPMNSEHRILAAKRRTRAEVQHLVAEFANSGMRRSEFCRSRRLSFGTLNRHLKKQRGKRKSRRISSSGQLVPVELATKKSAQHESSCPLVVVLSGGCRIEVQRDFDTTTFARLVSVPSGRSRVWTGSCHADLSVCWNHRHAEGVRGSLRPRAGSVVV